MSPIGPSLTSAKSAFMSAVGVRNGRKAEVAETSFMTDSVEKVGSVSSRKFCRIANNTFD